MREAAGRIIVSGAGKLRVFLWPELSKSEETILAGSGALCAGRGSVFAASDENAIYRLDRRTLLPQSVYAGGPGMRVLCLSADGRRLYALLSDADSVLMLGADTGAMLMLARVGVCPQSMRFDDTGQRLVIAGGKDGCAYLLCAQTLKLLGRYSADGHCADASARAGCVRALRFCGERVCAAAGKLIHADGVTLLLDPLTERLFCRVGGEWRLVCDSARDVAVLLDRE